MITCQGTTQARKSNEHVSISAPGIRLGSVLASASAAALVSASARAHTCPDMPAVKTGNRRREPGVAFICRLPPRTAAGLAVRIISMAVRDHASLVTHRNRNLVSTTVINSSQKRTCATMLTLTSHYMATNAKHPRYAPGLFGWLATHCNRRGRYRLREKVCREFWGLRLAGARLALGVRAGGVGVTAGAGGRLGRDGAGGVDLAGRHGRGRAGRCGPGRAGRAGAGVGLGWAGRAGRAVGRRPRAFGPRDAGRRLATAV